MGPDLHRVWNDNGNYYSTVSVLWLFKEVLTQLEKSHGTGMVHRDIKPENICYGKTADEVDIRLVDLGMSTPFVCFETGKHLPMDYGAFKGGTILYCSSNQHDGGSPSRKDDIEGLLVTQ